MAQKETAQLSLEAMKPDPSGRILLITVDSSDFLSGDSAILRFHYTPIKHTPEEIIAAGDDMDKLKPKSIWFDGEEYGLWPFRVEGITMTTEQQQMAKLSVANLSGFVSALCISPGANDLVGAKVTITQTYVAFLDARNFADGNSKADPKQKYSQTYLIDRKSYVDGTMVTFELNNPMDFTGRMIPTRQITPYCHWQMRGWYKKGFGFGCTYDPAQNGDRMFDEDGNPVTDSALDKCGGCASDCKIRFGENAELPFGGFAAVSLYKR